MQIQRRSSPTRLDPAPRGTVCIVNLKEPKNINGELLLESQRLRYIQVNKDESNPIWELIDGND
jgi:hypothetical protein